MQFASSLEKRIDHCMHDFVEKHLSKLRVQTRSELKFHLFNTSSKIGWKTQTQVCSINQHTDRGTNSVKYVERKKKKKLQRSIQSLTKSA